MAAFYARKQPSAQWVGHEDENKKNSDPDSAGLGPNGDPRPADRYSTFPFKVADPRTSLAIPLVLSRDSNNFLERAAYYWGVPPTNQV
jgi:hypothetical protein